MHPLMVYVDYHHFEKKLIVSRFFDRATLFGINLTEVCNLDQLMVILYFHRVSIGDVVAILTFF